MLKTLCNIVSVSGYEDTITNYISSILKGNENFEVAIDNIGNVICHLKRHSSKQKFLILAHIDEVGCQITEQIDDNCFKFKTLGNIKAWNLNNQRIAFENGTNGVVYCDDETNMQAKNFENMYVYTDLLGRVTVGDTFTFAGNFLDTADSFISKSLDNRISVYVLLQLIEKIDLRNVDFDLYIVFTTQEEIGMRGAKVAISTICPDIALTVDTTNIGIYNNIKLGKGVAIKISDGIGVSDRKLTEKIKDIGQENKIPMQFEVSDCGTTEMIMVNEVDFGSRNIGLAVPCQFMHSANTIVKKADYESFKRLLFLILQNI